jgi:NAD(P)-dependent dehydrogenase (short-subunit alcohol dehydrogenase family)
LRAFALAPGVLDTDMQGLVRSAPVERFHRMHADDRCNAPEHVARFVFDEMLPEGSDGHQAGRTVRRRVPDASSGHCCRGVS